MDSDDLFFSLKWKLAILFGGFFLLLISAFSYIAYVNDQSEFEKYRAEIQATHASTIKALTNDSFAALEQLGELITAANSLDANRKPDGTVGISVIDAKWSQWQLAQGIQSMAYFDPQGKDVKVWGETLPGASLGVNKVMDSLKPEYTIICPDICYQQVTIPLLEKARLTGILSVARTYADVMMKYKNAATSDLGILSGRQLSASATEHLIKSNGVGYCLCAMTNLELNAPVFQAIAKHYTVQQLYGKGKRIELNNSVYEVFARPVQQAIAEKNPVYYLFIDDITLGIKQLNVNLKQIWLYSVLGLIGVLSLIVFFSHLFFRRISALSKALPLLAAKEFAQFRQQVSPTGMALVGLDEIDTLSQTALILSDQLESLEQKMRSHTFSLLEKSQELAKERDFIRQLFDLAPVIIIIQKQNGIILSINDAAKTALETDDSVIGKVFDIFIPETDQEHLNRLERLRSQDNLEPMQMDGSLLTMSGKTLTISWLHKLLPIREEDGGKVILTLGVDISERKMVEARNIRMAYYDYLTGLSNRRKFQEEFSQSIAAASRYGYQLAVLYMDLDRFKDVNDTCGHETGDNFLKMVADILRGAIRTTDLLCRLGGDEFILLMPHADFAGVDFMANKINTVLKSQVFNCSGKSFSPSASIGVAIFPEHGQTTNELMANADLAMYRAKELGRGKHHVFSQEYDYRSKINQMVHWRAVLEDAINKDKFVLFYQPILNIKKQKISHFECLLRLQTDGERIIMPSEFVARAEELGLISKIDRIVLKKALAQHLTFKQEGKFYKLSINISRRSFEDPTLFEDFKQMLDNPEIDQNNIIFEITDNSVLVNTQTTNELIARIKDLGCVLALNDFGIEYPSLHYLKNAPVDYVKIDGSLIRQIDKNTEDKAFVKALTEVAQAFGKKTVAEFVENEEILVILKEFGIDYAQGYYIGRPALLENNAMPDQDENNH